MKNLWNREPVAIIAAVQAVVAVAVSFGAELTAEQQGLLFAALAAVLGLFARSQVTPVDNSRSVAANMAGNSTRDAGYGLLVTILIVLGIIILAILIIQNVDVGVKSDMGARLALF